MPNPAIRAVLWDFGGVVTESPFVAFRAYERAHHLPDGFLRSVNARNPDGNAWARLERGELTPEAFDQAFAEESRALGHEVRGLDVVDLVFGPVRPMMLDAIRRCRCHFITACLTNNMQPAGRRGLERRPELERDWHSALSLFDQVIESSKVGVRKPEPRFFELACAHLEVEPTQAVFLDDLGINLKPARAMGMHTIKVTEPQAALRELSGLLQITLQ
jgi:putative hydrolase of the HAD superfamily